MAALLVGPAGARARELTPPALLHGASPALPAHLLDARGSVVVRFVVGPDGSLSGFEVLEATDPELAALAMSAAHELRFEPGRVDDEPAAVQVDYTFVFEPAPPTATLRGSIVDARGRPLPGVLVTIPGTERATSTDAEGHFVLSALPPGQLRVVMFHEEHQRAVHSVDLRAGEATQVEATLSPRAGDPETIVVLRSPWQEVERAPLGPEPGAVVGRWTLSRRDLELTAGAMGDVAKVVGQLPGVAADTDMFAEIHVRGGDADETVFTLDGVPLLNPNHLGGTFTMFNPKLVDSVQLWSATAPASTPDSLAGALTVTYADPSADQVDGILDVNMAMAAAHVSGPLGRAGAPVTFLLSARRSYFEAYMGLLKATKVLSDQFVDMNFGEYLGRVVIGRESAPHRVRLSILHGHDAMVLGGEDDDEALVSIASDITNRNHTTLLLTDWRWRVTPRVSWSSRAWISADSEKRQQAADFAVTRTVQTWRPGAFGELDVEVSSGNHVRAGFDVSQFSTAGDGRVKDPRVSPTWTALPWARFTSSEIAFDPNRTWVEAAGWLENDWQGVGGSPVNLRTGLRLQWLGQTRELLPSPRATVSVPLPTGTILKVSGGLVHQPIRDAMVLDPALGGTPRAERGLQIAGGVEQGLPFGVLLRVEGWYRRLDRLLVHPDTTAALDRGGSWRSVGTGHAEGLDALLAAHVGRVNGMVSYSLSSARRTNPLNEAGPTTYAVAWDQRHTLKVRVSVTIGARERWFLGLAGEVRSGRPRSPTHRRVQDGGWVQVPYAYNSEDYGTWAEVSVRAEHRIPIRDKVRLAVYLDVLNATFAQSEFVWIYGQGELADNGIDGAPRPFVFRQLPIRPWIGARLEY